jgi:hypothetical protein
MDTVPPTASVLQGVAAHKFRNRAVFHAVGKARLSGLLVWGPRMRKSQRTCSQETRQQGRSLGQLVCFPSLHSLKRHQRRTFVRNKDGRLTSTQRRDGSVVSFLMLANSLVHAKGFWIYTAACGAAKAPVEGLMQYGPLSMQLADDHCWRDKVVCNYR